ncbi:cytochrome P450 9e2 [Aethina tumida]|uniref:cytochrome P450 9e2 n=1 Tax=Aethina tumida TaxID=116153 RepID=UPI002147D46D|nr:cytochrome P450 9e2 [Aethina tumida]
MLLFTLFVILIIFLILNYIKLLNYWKNKNVKFITPVPILGNFTKNVLQLESLSDLSMKVYNSFPGERYIGAFQFTSPILVVRDLELIKKILIKDFDHFVDHHILFKPDVDPLWGKTLFSSQGEQWRDLRQTLSPVFTSSKMKSMFLLMRECAQQYVNHIKELDQKSLQFEAREVLSKFTVDVIGTTAFGIQCNSFIDNEFLKNAKMLTDFNGIRKLLLLLTGVPSIILKMFNIKIIRDNVGNFFRNIVSETIQYREKNHIIRPDLIHLLMEARKGKLKYEEEAETNNGFSVTTESEIGRGKSAKKIDLSDENITAQALIFFFGGYDTTSILMDFMTYELCANQDIQGKLRKEMFDKVENVNEVTYEELQGLKYLDMVVSETLRKWNIAIFIERICTKEYTIAAQLPHETDLIVEEGSSIWVPAFGLHRDPQYYPNPDKFDPERFSDENKTKINSLTYLPFGAGPRNCIGSRYALLTAKVLFFYILTNFKIVPNEKTVIPLVLSKTQLILGAQDGVWFNLEKLSN